MNIGNILKSLFFAVLILSLMPGIISYFGEMRQASNPLNVSVQVIQIGGSAINGIENGIWSAQPYVHELEQAGEDPKVKAVVLSINSPGGVPGSSELIGRAVARVRD